MKEIALTNSQMKAIVSDEDYNFLNTHKWYLHHTGYPTMSKYIAKGKTKHISMHRLVMGLDTKSDIDHIDRNKLNNQRENLRFASRKQNMANKGKYLRSICHSVFKGVSLQKGKYWIACVIVNGKTKLIHAPSEFDAARIYNENAVREYGEFAQLNNIPTNESLNRFTEKRFYKKKQ